MWVVAELDDDYIAKMEDVRETYELPYDPQQPVVCLDQKPVTLDIHREKSLEEVFGAEMAAEVWDRFTVDYTPTHRSWLNPVEIEIGIFTQQCLGK